MDDGVDSRSLTSHSWITNFSESRSSPDEISSCCTYTTACKCRSTEVCQASRNGSYSNGHVLTCPLADNNVCLIWFLIFAYRLCTDRNVWIRLFRHSGACLPALGSLRPGVTLPCTDKAINEFRIRYVAAVGLHLIRLIIHSNICPPGPICRARGRSTRGWTWVNAWTFTTTKKYVAIAGSHQYSVAT